MIIRDVNLLKKVDVLIIGGGNAALCAAIAAAEHNNSVLVIEKASTEHRGGNSSLTMNFRFPHSGVDELINLLNMSENRESELQRLQRLYAPYSVDDLYNDFFNSSNYLADKDLIYTISNNALNTIKWLKSYGHSWEIKPNILSGSLPIRIKGGGQRLVEQHYNIIEKLNVMIAYDCNFKNLLIKDDCIIGAIIEYHHKQININAKTIILACGSFEANAQMRKKYLGDSWEHVAIRGVPYNTGAGIEAASLIGAQQVGDYSHCHATPQSSDLKNYMLPAEFKESQANSRYAFNYGISVNLNGQRFFDEGAALPNFLYAKIGELIIAQHQQIAFQIFDANTVKYLPRTYFETDNYVQANSISELSKLMGVNQQMFTDTITLYNQHTDAKKINLSRLDGISTFNLALPKSNWALAIHKPPFFGFPVKTGVTFTYGGLKINTKAQVIKNNGLPFANLFACGEIVGGIFWGNYAGGSGLMSGAVFGRIAGTNAANWCKS